jgi:hypothetical protein
MDGAMYKYRMNEVKPTYLGNKFRTGMDGSPTSQTHDSSKQSLMFMYSPARFGLGGIGSAPKGPTQAS